MPLLGRARTREADRAPRETEHELASTSTSTAALVALSGIVKSYGGFRALDDVSITLAAGEIHALCGHNGAGKSSIVRVLSGLTIPDEGTLEVDGVPVAIRSPSDSQHLGIAVVEQELAQVGDLTVADNIFLGHADTPLRYRRQHEQAREHLDRVGLTEIDPAQRLHELRLGERQLVEIARMLARKARVLVLDEPTATLGAADIERVFCVLNDLVSQGCGVLFVTHRLGEVFTYCDRVTVLRDGRRIASRPLAEMTRNELVELMVDSKPGRRAVPGANVVPGDPVLTIEGVTVPGTVVDASLTAHRGQVVALAGQVGSGATELLRAVAGLEPTATGVVDLGGRSVALGSRRRAAKHAIAYVTDDRKADGLFFDRDGVENVAAGYLACQPTLATTRRARLVAMAAKLGARAHFDTNRLEATPEQLSGGNQQKLLIARALSGGAGNGAVLLNEPTRGVDIHARGDIHAMMRDVSAAGTAVVFASTDLEEVFEVADVIYTMFAGSIVARYERQEAAATQVLADMTDRDAAAGGLLLDEIEEELVRAAEQAPTPVGAEISSALTDPARDSRRVDEPEPQEPVAVTHRTLLRPVIAVLAVVALATAALTTPGFFSVTNAQVILTSATITGLLAVGITPIMICGRSFSLAMGVGLIICAMVFLEALRWNIPVAVGAAVLVGLIMGVAQGFLIGTLGIEPIIGTIAFGSIATGVALWATGGNTVLPATTSRTYNDLANTVILGIPLETLVLLAVAAAVYALMQWTVWGRQSYLVGANDAAARTTGISRPRVVLIAFTIAGVCAGVAGVLVGAHNSAATLAFTITYDFDALTAVLAGGVLITGGSGSVGRALIGALGLAVLSDLLLLHGAGLAEQTFVKGLIVLLAVSVTARVRRRQKGA